MTNGKSNIVLIGMPGVGKSTIGVLLAKRLRCQFLDTDVLIQVAHDKSLHKLIEEQGMKGFCRLEQDYLNSINVSNAVIATGGSAVYYESSMEALKSAGVLVYLQLSLKELQERLGDLNQRGVVLEPGQTFTQLYKKRAPLYKQWADIVVNLSGLNHDNGLELILKTLGINNAAT